MLQKLFWGRVLELLETLSLLFIFIENWENTDMCGILNEFPKNEGYNDIYVTETVYVQLNSTFFAKYTDCLSRCN
jgi:hypothetical protein